MSGFQFSPLALADLNEILLNHEDFHGLHAARDVEGQILRACERLVETPGLGHRRSDLTSRAVFFHTVDPYLIVHTRRPDPIPILAVLHSSRNIRKLLRARFRTTR